jgi:hypothetical protein
MDVADVDVLASHAFPPAQWRRMWRTHPLGTTDQGGAAAPRREGTCPTAAAVPRLIGEIVRAPPVVWQAGRCAGSLKSRANLLPPVTDPPLRAASSSTAMMETTRWH